MDKNGRLAHRVAAQEAHSGVEAWGAWAALDGFPGAASSALDRYRFVEAHVRDVLDAKPHPTHPDRERRDLNGRAGANRVWLVKMVLRSLIRGPRHRGARSNSAPASGGYSFPEDLAKVVGDLRPQIDHPGEAASGGYTFPEDLAKVADDIRSLIDHHGELPVFRRSLTSYGSAEELRDAVSQWRAKFVLSAADREAANRRFLRGPGSRGNGMAERVATLPDGSELIRPLSKAASIAYGSPHWCVSYRGKKNWFDEYRHGLVFLLAPDGERWGFHFPSGQFVDSDDRPIGDLARFVTERDGLAQALAPFVEAALEPSASYECLTTCELHPIWLDALRETWADEFQAIEGGGALLDALQESQVDLVNRSEACGLTNFWLVKIIERHPSRAFAILWAISHAKIGFDENTPLCSTLALALPSVYADKMIPQLFAYALDEETRDYVCEQLVEIIRRDPGRALSVLWGIDANSLTENGLAALRMELWRLCPRDYMAKMLPFLVRNAVEDTSGHVADWLLKFVKADPSCAVAILETIDPEAFNFDDLDDLATLLGSDFPEEFAAMTARAGEESAADESSVDDDDDHDEDEDCGPFNADGALTESALDECFGSGASWPWRIVGFPILLGRRLHLNAFDLAGSVRTRISALRQRIFA